MEGYSLLKIIAAALLLIIGSAAAPMAQDDTELITARGFGGTQEQALEQASYHAVIQVVENNFASHQAYAAHKEDVRQFIQDNLAQFLGDSAEIKIVMTYMRKKLRARIPVRTADVVAAVKDNFPDLAAP